MARNDWYRRTTWSRDDQAAFHARLERSRSSFHKAQYARVQAVYLERTGDRKLIVAALELLNLVLAKWPEPFQLSCVYWQKATCHEPLGDLDSAAEDFRKTIEAEEMPGGAQTGARINSLGW